MVKVNHLLLTINYAALFHQGQNLLMVKVNHLLLTINSAANIIIYSIKVSIYSW
jgi:hypothetical protein